MLFDERAPLSEGMVQTLTPPRTFAHRWVPFVVPSSTDQGISLPEVRTSVFPNFGVSCGYDRGVKSKSSRKTSTELARMRVVAAASLVALMGVVGLGGGFLSANPQKVIVTDGETEGTSPVWIKAAPFEMEIQRSYIVDSARVIEMNIVNHATVPISGPDFVRGFKLLDSNRREADLPFVPKSAHRIETGVPLEKIPRGSIPPFNPNVPARIVLVFEDVSDDADLSFEVAGADQLQIWSREYRRTPLDGSTGWWLGDPVAEVAFE